MAISYDQWIELTRLGALSPRPDNLKKLDQALKNYEQFCTREYLKFLREAFENWKAGKDWQHDERNRKGAATRLQEMLSGPPDALAPLDFILQEQERRIDTLFRGRKLVTKISVKSAVTQIYSVGSNLENIRRAATHLAPSGGGGFEKVIRDLLAKFFGDFNVSWEVDLANYLGENFLPDFVKSLIPYAGVLTSGANALAQFGMLARSAYRRHEVTDCRDAVREGDPRKAIEAIRRILKHDMNVRAVQGTMASFEAVARGVTTGVTGGAGEVVVSALFSIGKLMYVVYEVGCDFRDKYHANTVLTGMAPVTYTVFDKYPLIGAYYLVCVDTSDVVNFMIRDMAAPNRDWKKEVEDLKKRLDPAISIGRSVIDSSRFEIENMPKMPRRMEISAEQERAISAKIAQQGHGEKAINFLER